MRLYTFILAFVVFALLQACRTETRVPHQTDMLILAADSTPTNLDPRIGIDKASEDFHHLIFNGLLKKNEQDRMVPDLALSFQKLSPVLYRFQLRPGVRFHDGKLLDAEDVAFTYRSILNGEINTTKKATLESISDIRAPTPDLVEIHLREPFNGLLVNLNIGIVPKNSAADFARKPVGTGPYRLKDFHPDSGAVLEAFPQYFEGSPKMKILQIRIIPDATTRALELRKGSVDLVISATPADYFRVLKEDPHLETMIAQGNNYAYIGLNVRDPVLKKKEIRQAIGYAINRAEIVENLFHGTPRLATGILAPHHWSYEENVPQYSYDPDRARQLLDKAGYSDPDGDGPGMRFHLTYKISTNEFRRLVATVVQDHLSKVGIGIKIRSYEWGTFFSDVNRGNFQMCMLMWVGISDPDHFRNVFQTGARWNRGGYSNAQVDQWVNLAKTATTELEQKEYYSLIQKKIAEDTPYISLWYESNTAVMRKELDGMRLTPDADYRVLKDVYWR